MSGCNPGRQRGAAAPALAGGRADTVSALPAAATGVGVAATAAGAAGAVGVATAGAPAGAAVGVAACGAWATVHAGASSTATAHSDTVTAQGKRKRACKVIILLRLRQIRFWPVQRHRRGVRAAASRCRPHTAAGTAAGAMRPAAGPAAACGWRAPTRHTASTTVQTGMPAAAAATATADSRQVAATAAMPTRDRAQWGACPPLPPPARRPFCRWPLRKGRQCQRVQVRAEVNQACPGPWGAHGDHAVGVGGPLAAQRAKGRAHEAAQPGARWRVAGATPDRNGEARPQGCLIGRTGGQLQVVAVAAHAAAQHPPDLALPTQAIATAKSAARSRDLGGKSRIAHGHGQAGVVGGGRPDKLSWS